MGGSPIVVGSTPMVSSPLHITSALDLEQRLVKASSIVITAPELDGVPTLESANKANNHHECPLRLGMEEHPMLDDSHGSSIDLAIRKLLQRSSVSDPSEMKHVAFGDISTRAYDMVLGDHPCCAMGCPLSLGWEYAQCPSVSVDEYEAARLPRRTRECLKTSWQQRRDMLADVSDREVKHNERKLHRERSCHRGRNRRVCAAFFSQPTAPPHQQQQHAQCT